MNLLYKKKKCHWYNLVDHIIVIFWLFPSWTRWECRMESFVSVIDLWAGTSCVHVGGRLEMARYIFWPLQSVLASIFSTVRIASHCHIVCCQDLASAQDWYPAVSTTIFMGMNAKAAIHPSLPDLTAKVPWSASVAGCGVAQQCTLHRSQHRCLEVADRWRQWY